MVRKSSQHWTSSRRLAFCNVKIGLKKPWLRRGNSCTLGCISFTWCFFCSWWWCVDSEYSKEETSSHGSLPIKVRCNASTDFLLEPSSVTIAHVDSKIGGKRVWENNTQLLSWHWPADDESMLLICTSIVDMTMLSIINAVIADLPDHSWKIRKLLGCQEDPAGDGCPYARNDTPICDNNTAARSVKVAMRSSNPTLFCFVYRGRQADDTAGTQMAMCIVSNYLWLDDILPPPAEDMIHNTGEESDDDVETRCPNPTSFPMTKTGFQKYESKLQKTIFRQRRYLEVFRNCALGLFAEYEHSLVADKNVAWLCKHDHIGNPPAAGALANRKHTSSRPAATWSWWGWNGLAGRSFKDLLLQGCLHLSKYTST